MLTWRVVSMHAVPSEEEHWRTSISFICRPGLSLPLLRTYGRLRFVVAVHAKLEEHAVSQVHRTSEH